MVLASIFHLCALKNTVCVGWISNLETVTENQMLRKVFLPLFKERKLVSPQQIWQAVILQMRQRHPINTWGCKIIIYYFTVQRKRRGENWSKVLKEGAEEDQNWRGGALRESHFISSSHENSSLKWTTRIHFQK